MLKYPTIYSLLALALYAFPAEAAPFCVQMQGIPAQCDYVDANQCRKQANELQAMCVLNPTEKPVKTGSGAYCLTGRGQTASCLYTDRTSCERDATGINGICIENAVNGIQPDPYQSDPNREY